MSACTTTEGTNAFTSAQTFEDEVLNPAAAGIGLIPPPATKPDPTNPRGPLVMPKADTVVPPPTKDTDTAQLPVDNGAPKVDTTGLSQADLDKIKHVRVVDINTPDGRPLTAAELKQLTGRDERLYAQQQALDLHTARTVFQPGWRASRISSA